MLLDVERRSDSSVNGWGFHLSTAALDSAGLLPAVLRTLGLAGGDLASIMLLSCSVQSTALSLGQMASSVTKVFISDAHAT